MVKLPLWAKWSALIALGALNACTCGGDGTFGSDILSPLDGALLRGSSFEISGTASAEDTTLQKVEVSVDDGATWQDASGTEVWTFTWTGPADGTYVIRSRAVNERDTVEDTVPAITVTVDNTPPQVAVSSLSEGQLVVGTAHALSGTASDANGIAQVELSLDGASWVTASGTTTWSYDWTPLPPDGAFSLRVRATDSAGNVSAPLAVGVVIDRELPSSVVTAPAAGAFLSGGTVTVEGRGLSTWSTVQQVEVSTDEGATWQLASGVDPFSYAWTLPADGERRLFVRARDVLGGTQAEPTVVTFVVDQTAPGSLLISPAADLAINGASFLVEGTAADPLASDGTASGVAQVEVSTDDGATWTAATGASAWSFAWTLPADGTYVLRTRATDLAGNVELGLPVRTMIVDNTAAVASFTTPAANAALAQTSVVLSGEASDNLSGVQRVELSINGGTWTAASGATAWSYTFAPGADGQYAARVRAVDVAGNVALPSAERTFLLDVTPPVVAVTAPSPGALLVGTQATISGTAADALGLSRVELSFDGGATWVAASGTASWSYAWNPLPADGPATVTVRSVDLAGNPSEAAALGVVVDRELPTSAITAPIAGSFLKDATVTIEGTSASTYASVAQVDVSTDDGLTWTAASGTSPFTFAWSPVTDGRYRLRSRAKDIWGGYEAAPALVQVTVDQTAPGSTLTQPAAPIAINGSSTTLQGTAFDPAAVDGSSSGLAQVEVSTDDGATWSAAAGTSTWAANWTLPADGTYQLRTRATDAAGNVETPSAGLAIIVDNTGPSAAILSPATGSTLGGTSVTVSGSAADALSGVARVEVSANGGPWVAANGTTSWSYLFEPGADALYSLRARAVDVAGNVGEPSGTQIFTLDGTAPSCAVQDPADGQAISGTTFQVAGAADDATSGLARVEFSSDDGTTWANAAGTTAWTFTFTPTSSGTYRLRCRATDRAGNVGVQPAANVVTVDTSVPWSRILAPVNGEATSAAGYQLQGEAGASAAAIVKVEVSTDNGGTWAVASGTNAWTFDWPSVAEGTYTLRSRATNSNGTTEQSSPPVTVTFDRTSPTSAPTSPPSGTALRGSEATVSGIAQDGLSGVALVEISFDDGGSWTPVTSGTALWSHTWALPADGTYAVRSRATDRAGNVQATTANVILIVDNASPSSAIGQPAANAALRGATATVSGTASDGAGSGILRVELSMDGGQSWVTAGGSTVWSYAWTLPTDGTYTIQARAVDQAGNVEPGGPSVTVKVDNTPPAAVIVSPVAGANLRDGSVTLSGTAGDGAGTGVQRVEVSTNNGASWSLATGTTAWSYNWSTPGDGQVTVRARAVDVAGNTEAPGASVTVRIDKTAPATTLVSPSNDANLTGAQVTVSGLVAEGGSGISTVELSTDNGVTWSTAELSGTTWTYVWTLPADGTYQLRSRGTDQAGNVETPQAGHRVKVDNTAPASVIVSPADGAAVNLATYTVMGTATDGPGAGVTGVELSTDDGATWAAATLTGPGTWQYSWSTGADGVYRLRSRATDAVGLVETPGAGNQVSVDRTAPTSAIVSPADGTGISTLTQAISGTAQDGTGSGVVRVEISTDSGATFVNATGAAAWSHLWTLPAAPGSHGIHARAVDAAGNVQSPATVFTYHALPVVSLIVPSQTAAGTAVTLAGYRFGTTQDGSTVTFNGTAAGTALAWSSGQVRLAVPASATTGDVVVRANALDSVGVPFTVLAQPAPGASTVVAGGRWTATRLGPDGLPRVAHTNGTDTQVMFASYAGGTWTNLVLEAVAAGTVRHLSLAVDANGVNHLAYQHNTTPAALRYARCATACHQLASWTLSTVASGTNLGQHPSIAVGTANLPRIAYYDGGSGACGANACARFASFDGAAWTLETIDQVTSANVGQYISLALDSLGRPHVAYYDSVNRNLVYAAKVTAWGQVSLATTDRVGQHPSIALKDDLARIAFTNDTANSLDVFTFDGAVWSRVTVDSGVDGKNATVNTELLVGNDGRDRVIYFHTVSGALKLAVLDQGVWTASTLVPGAGAYCSGALDGLNRARAAYLAGGNLGYFSQP